MKKKIKIHKEGHSILLVSGFILLIFTITAALLFHNLLAYYISAAVSISILGAFAYFFRLPSRNFITGDNQIIAPADGRVVVIEEVHEGEYFGDKRIQVSIFMSPANVHVNRNPISGVVKYQKYHPGKYLVAWHPKSSTENERTTTVIESQSEVQILFRQIAGALAKRIVWYVKEGQQVHQG